MRKIGYLTAALFALGFVFIASSSFSQEWVEAEVTGYSTAPMAWSTFDARGVVGTDFRASDGTVLGHIDDFIIDPATGRISFVVVSDVEGLGAEHIDVPFSFISQTGPNVLAYNPPEDCLLQYGVPLYWSYGLNRFRGEMNSAGTYESNRMFGATVQTSDSMEAGRIDDIVFASDGHVLYFVLTDVGRTENRMVAVPFGTLSRSGEIYVLSITNDRLMGAPVFAWSNTGDRVYTVEIYRYYGLQPYWEMHEK